jgi:hypothetical protein
LDLAAATHGVANATLLTEDFSRACFMNCGFAQLLLLGSQWAVASADRSIVHHDGMMHSEATGEPCVDLGPWPCSEDGCPSPSIGCPDLGSLCDMPFTELWTESLPDASLAGLRVADKCRVTCNTCATAEPELEYDFPISIPLSVEKASYEWNAAGVAAFEQGDVKSAAEHLTIGSHQHSNRGELFSNLALALSTLARTTNPAQRLAMVCEARAAAQLARELGHRNAPAGLMEQIQALETSFGGGHSARDGAPHPPQRLTCADTEGGALQVTLDHAIRTVGEAAGGLGDHGQGAPSLRAGVASAVGVVCTPAHLVLRSGRAERLRGVLSAKTLRAAHWLMRLCGVVSVEGLLPEALVADLSAAQATDFERRVAPRVAAMAPAGVETDDEIAIRGSTKRVEVKLPMQKPFRDERLVASPLGLSLLRMWMRTGGFELDTFSYIHAAPGSLAQHWHTDVQPLHGSIASVPNNTAAAATDTLSTADADAGAHAHAQTADTSPLGPPTHGIVQITPLVDVAHGTGATQFLCGSHLAVLEVQPPGPHHGLKHVSLTVPRGSVAFMDLRLTHRGGAHDGPRPRAVLYMSYVREWFRDTVNFGGKQSRAWDDLPSHRLRKLLARIDARGYVHLLEDRLRAAGIDPAELASAAGVRPPDLRV